MTPIRRPKRFRRLVWVVVAIVVAGTIWSRTHHKAPPPAPTTIAVSRGDVQVAVADSGLVETTNKIDIKSKVAGRILQLLVREGEPVQAGQLIATVDRELIGPQIKSAQAQLDQARARLVQSQRSYALQREQTQSSIAQAQASLDSAKIHLSQVRAGARPQEIAQQREAVARAQVAVDDALRTLKRKQDLATKGFVPQSDADSAQVAADTARSNLASAQQQLSLTLAGPRQVDVDEARAGVVSARTQLDAARINAAQDDIRKSDVVQAQASVDQAANQLAQLQVNVSDTRIVAPASGIVMKIYKHADEIVQSATTGFSDQQSLIATLGGAVDIKLWINEVDVAKVHVGMPTGITVDALPGVDMKGHVTTIAPASTNAYGDSSAGGGGSGGNQNVARFVVTVGVDRPEPRLRPGMSANVRIVVDERKNVVTVPLDALSQIPGTTGNLTVLGPGGKKVTRPVTIGLRSDVVAEVKTGLSPGEKVVLDMGGPRRKMFDGPGGGPN